MCRTLNPEPGMLPPRMSNDTPEQKKAATLDKGDVCAVIVAAGAGRRMKSQIPKQFLPLGGKPVLARTVKAFAECTAVDRIVVVVAAGDFDHCRRAVLPVAGCKKPLTMAEGGGHRAESVFNGLEAAGVETGLVVIHDGVRPLIRSEQIAAVVEKARESGACILAAPVFDTLKKVSPTGKIQHTVDRTDLWAAQTPQAFRFDLIRRAHLRAKQAGASVTDDAQLVERMDRTVSVVAGGRFNLKITTEDDLKTAEALLVALGGG